MERICTDIERIVSRYDTHIKQQPYEFIEFEREIMAINPEIILEIGILRGGIISYFRNRVKQVIGIDHKNKFKYFNDIIIGDSHSDKTLQEVYRRLNNSKIDVLYIDGDGSYEGTKKDYEMYSPLVRNGGIIAFHDIISDRIDNKGKPIVVERYKVWNDIKNRYKHREIVDESNRWGGVGILWV